MTDDQRADAFFDAVEKACAHGVGLAGLDGVALINAVTRHVSTLLNDALEAFHRESYGTSVFLCITALEETAKGEMLAYRLQRSGEGHKQGRDPLRSHKGKHVIAVRPTTFMGRLPEILGKDVCARLAAEAESGDFAELRERALYAYADKDGISTPATAITSQRAREMFLLACECADDILVGYTEESMVLGKRFGDWIERFRMQQNS
jgi:AbiV family abortive infection protein